MKNLTERQKVKTSFLREFSRISKIKAEWIANRKSQGLFLKEGIGSKRVSDNTPMLTARKITQCILPPFQEGIGSTDYQHPRSTFAPYDYIESVFNPYSFANPVTGEMSLAVVSGQNQADFYGGGTPYYFGEAPADPAFFQQSACAIISQRVDIAAYPYDTVVEISLEAELPVNGASAVHFVFGDGHGPLQGELAAMGWLDLYTGALESHDYITNGVTYMFLGASGTSFDPPALTVYDANPRISCSFVLPAGADHFWIHVNGQINAFSTVSGGPESANPAVRNYALVDFREQNSQYPILRSNEFLNGDHPAPGTIKIKKICYSIEPRFVKLPDTE